MNRFEVNATFDTKSVAPELDISNTTTVCWVALLHRQRKLTAFVVVTAIGPLKGGLSSSSTHMSCN